MFKVRNRPNEFGLYRRHRLCFRTWMNEPRLQPDAKHGTEHDEHRTKRGPLRQTRLDFHTPAIGCLLEPLYHLLPIRPPKLCECIRAHVPLNLHSITELVCVTNQGFPLIPCWRRWGQSYGYCTNDRPASELTRLCRSPWVGIFLQWITPRKPKLLMEIFHGRPLYYSL